MLHSNPLTHQPTTPPLTKPRPIRTSTEHAIEVPRTARYYTVGDAVGGDLWVVLHGFGQLAGDFIEYFVGLNDGSRVIAAPEALNRYYTTSLTVPGAERPVGATWMTREHREAEMRDYVRYLDLLHAELAARYRPRRTIVVGFSQGGATASRWVARGSTSVHSLVLWGALLPPDLDLAAARERLTASRLTIVLGRTDQYIAADAAARERDRLAAAGIPFGLIEYDAGHSIKRAVLADLAARIATA
jgi:predicted esterase